MDSELQEILIPDENSDNSKDTERDEEKWDERKENYFKRMKDELLEQANKHNVCSHKNKKKYIYTSIPTMILPLILVNCSIFVNEYEYIQPIGLTIVSIINGFQTLLNFSKKKEIHNLYAGKYIELANDIDKILIRKKRYRESFDVVLERMTLKKQQLDDTAPYL
jgi:hypothetical protein